MNAKSSSKEISHYVGTAVEKLQSKFPTTVYMR